jgi:hypothetical protein
MDTLEENGEEDYVTVHVRIEIAGMLEVEGNL